MSCAAASGAGVSRSTYRIGSAAPGAGSSSAIVRNSSLALSPAASASAASGNAAASPLLVVVVGGQAHARDVLTDDDFIRQARRRAQGGKRAEDAVLNLAVSDPLIWRRADAVGFEAAFERVARVFDARDSNTARARFDAATTESNMRRFLHVTEYVGNVGFDFLVPSSGRLLFVEVKCVSELRRAAFFLSENERR
ncbi:MAG: DUF3883 domain-containing protein [Candidatus Schekmanbacteria bacterium]|nr:DUF3883 domain-containing protein [Candidatus Schekmanbacteria bacterium]